MSISSYNAVVNCVSNSIGTGSFFDAFSIEKRKSILLSNESFLYFIKQDSSLNSEQIHNLIVLNQKWVTQAKGGVISNFILRILGRSQEVDQLESKAQRLLSKADKIDILAGFGLRKQKISPFLQVPESPTCELEKEYEKFEIKSVFKKFKDALFKVKSQTTELSIKVPVNQLSTTFVENLAELIASDADSFWNGKNIKFIQFSKINF